MTIYSITVMDIMDKYYVWNLLSDSISEIYKLKLYHHSLPIIIEKKTPKNMHTKGGIMHDAWYHLHYRGV